MKRVPIIAGNWKMNKTLDKAVEFVNVIKDQLPSPDQCRVMIAAQPLFLADMIRAAANSPLQIFAENCYYHDFGAFTGEVSPLSLADMGVDGTILGHSERRKIFHESDELINKKVLAALRNNVSPLLCCDETMGRKVAGNEVHWVVSRILTDLRDVPREDLSKITIAYEPSWAIGSGQSADPVQAEEGCYLIRQTIADMYDDEAAQQMSVLYGGSVNAENASKLMASEDIDGCLIGGNSLKPETFMQLVNS